MAGRKVQVSMYNFRAPVLPEEGRLKSMFCIWPLRAHSSSCFSTPGRFGLEVFETCQSQRKHACASNFGPTGPSLGLPEARVPWRLERAGALELNKAKQNSTSTSRLPASSPSSSFPSHRLRTAVAPLSSCFNTQTHPTSPACAPTACDTASVG